MKPVFSPFNQIVSVEWKMGLAFKRLLTIGNLFFLIFFDWSKFQIFVFIKDRFWLLAVLESKDHIYFFQQFFSLTAHFSEHPLPATSTSTCSETHQNVRAPPNENDFTAREPLKEKRGQVIT